MTFPVRAGSARLAASGRINWGITEVAPISTLAISRHSRLGESAARTRAPTGKGSHPEDLAFPLHLIAQGHKEQKPQRIPRLR